MNESRLHPATFIGATVVLFRDDLRLGDILTLSAAVDSGAPGTTIGSAPGADTEPLERWRLQPTGSDRGCGLRGTWDPRERDGWSRQQTFHCCGLEPDASATRFGRQRVAGSRADAPSHLRVFNPQLQSKRIDPPGDDIGRQVPEWGASGYPESSVDLADSRRAALTAHHSLKIPSTKRMRMMS